MKIFSVVTNKYSIEYDIIYDNHQCTCSGYCRCSTINRVEIIQAPTMEEFEFIYRDSNKKSNQQLTDIEFYCLERIMTYYKYYDISNYEAIWSMSYYGEEVDSIDFKNKSLVEKEMTKVLNKNTPLQQILHVLDLEYSYIPEKLLKSTTTKILNLELKDVQSSSGQMQLIKRENHILYTPCSKIMGIVISDGKHCRLVDGHHRLKHLIQEGKTSAQYIILI